MFIYRILKNSLLLIALLVSAMPVAQAGVSYAGASGTFAQVFNSNPVEPCVTCHHSSLVDAARNGAPTGVNFDTYAWVSAPLYNDPLSLPTTNASQAVFMVTNGFMPYDYPSFVLTPLSGTLQTLMSNWEANGYPNIDIPDVTTVSAFSIGQTSVTLRGSTDPGGATATLRFRYGTDPTLSSFTLSTDFVATSSTGGNGVAQTLMDVDVTGLTCGTLYYYRGAATNSAGTGTGSILNFTTSACSPPVITVDTAPSYTENGAAAVLDGVISITDADSTQLNQATVDISTNFNGAQDELVYSTINGITGVYSSVTGTLTLTGTASLVQYEQALETVTYQNTSEDPTTGARTIVFQVRDTNNTLSSTDSISLTINALNDLPTITGVDGILPYTENAAATTVDGTIALADLDDANLILAEAEISTNCFLAEDRLEVSALTCSANNLTCTQTTNCALSITGTAPTPARALASYQNVLQAITYRNISNDPDESIRTVRMRVRDETTGFSSYDDKTITVAAVNDAPVISGVDNTPIYNEAGPAVTIDSSITVADPDSTCTQATIDLSTNYQSAEDELQYATMLGISADPFDSGTGTLTLTGAAACSDYGTALSSVTYINNSLNPSTAARTVVFQVTDASGGALSNAPSTTITVTASGTAPTVSNVNNVASYTENGSAVVIDPSISISDPDSTDLNQATVSITGNFSSGEDVLSYPSVIAGITGSYNTGVLTLTHVTGAALADFELALESVQYNNTSDNPSTAARTVEFVVRDDPSNISSSAVTTTLSVTAVNDAPSISVNNVAAFVEDVSGSVVIDPTIVISDAESNTLNQATVSITNNYASGEDQLIYAVPLHGVTVLSNVGGVLTLTGVATLTQYEEVLESVRYNNTSDTPNTAVRTIEFTARDAGTPNMTSSVFSTTLSVAASNDAPVISGVDNIANYTENAAAVVVDSAVTISDVDSAQLDGATVSVTNFVSGQDVLIYTGSVPGISDAYNSGTGVLTLTHATGTTLAAFEQALESVEYQNTSDNPNTATRTIAMRVRDTGTAVSTPDTTTLTITPVNDDPDAVDDPNLSVGVNTSNNALNVLVNDTDVEGDNLSVVEVTAVTNAPGSSLEVGNGSNGCAANTVCYTPAPDYTDLFVFTYRIEDDGSPAGTDTATATVGGTDSDGDGIIDFFDNCDLVQNANQLDTNNDGEGDLCDDDDDGDGMLDTFETTYDGVNGCELDPLDPSDAAEDCDGDGLNNAGEEAAGSDPTIDDVVPAFNGVQDITVDSTGYLTAVNLGNIRAVDGADGAVVISVDSVTGSTSQTNALNGLFRPGTTVITRSAEDSLNNVANSVQTINVLPLANFAPDQITVEGNTGVVARVYLNGEAPLSPDPVTIDYSVSGTSNGSDYTITPPSPLTFAPGQVTADISIDFNPDGTGEGNETLILTLSDPASIVLGAKRRHVITIAEGNVAPAVTLSVLQGTNVGALVTDGAGPVVVTANVSDPNALDTATFDWSGTPAPTGGTGTSASTTFEFDPLLEDLGPHSISVEVTDSAGATATSEVFLYLIQAADVPVFTPLADTDDDGFDDDDALEGYGDVDGDGIPNYLDAYEDIEQAHLIQNQTGDFDLAGRLENVKLVEAEPGFQIRKGPVAMYGNASGIMVSEDNIMDYADGNNERRSLADDDMVNIGGIYDFEISNMLPGMTARVVLPLSARILEGAVYRKFSLQNGWQDFSTSGDNAIASARASRGVCPAPGHSSYRNGLNAFDNCIELTLVDGGPNDADGEANGVIRDPGGVAVVDPSPVPEQEEPADGSGGGVLHPFWLWLLMWWSGFRIYKSRQIK